MKRQSKRRKEPENPEPAAAMDAESDDDVVVAAESGEGSAVVAEPPVSAVAVAVRKGKKKDTSSGRLFEPFRATIQKLFPPLADTQSHYVQSVSFDTQLGMQRAKSFLWNMRYRKSER